MTLRRANAGVDAPRGLARAAAHGAFLLCIASCSGTSSRGAPYGAGELGEGAGAEAGGAATGTGAAGGGAAGGAGTGGRAAGGAATGGSVTGGATTGGATTGGRAAGAGTGGAATGGAATGGAATGGAGADGGRGARGGGSGSPSAGSTGNGGTGGTSGSSVGGAGPKPGFDCYGDDVCTTGERCTSCELANSEWLARCTPDPAKDPATYSSLTADCMTISTRYFECDGPEDCASGQYCVAGNSSPGKCQAEPAAEPAACCFTCDALPVCTLCWTDQDCAAGYLCAPASGAPNAVGGCKVAD